MGLHTFSVITEAVVIATASAIGENSLFVWFVLNYNLELL